MKEKLLALLKTKFAGVQDATLERIATKKAEGITEESQLTTVVDGISHNDIIQSETDYRVQQASKTARDNAVKEYEKQHNLKDGKPIEEPEKKPVESTSTEQVPEWAKTIIKQNEELTKKVQGFENERATGSKREQAAAELAKSTKLPKKLQEKWIGRIDLTSETSIEDQVRALEDEWTDVHQGEINEEIKTGKYVPGSGKGEITDAAMTDFLDDKFPSDKAE